MIQQACCELASYVANPSGPEPYYDCPRHGLVGIHWKGGGRESGERVVHDGTAASGNPRDNGLFSTAANPAALLELVETIRYSQVFGAHPTWTTIIDDIRALEADVRLHQEEAARLLHINKAQDETHWKTRRSLVKERDTLKAEVRRLGRILETEHDDNCQWRVAEVGKLKAEIERLQKAIVHATKDQPYATEQLMELAHEAREEE